MKNRNIGVTEEVCVGLHVFSFFFFFFISGRGKTFVTSCLLTWKALPKGVGGGESEKGLESVCCLKALLRGRGRCLRSDIRYGLSHRFVIFFSVHV